MPRYVLGTNVYIAADRDPSFAGELERFATAHLPFIHLHAVVAQEMLAGAVDAAGERMTRDSYIVPFERRGRPVTADYNAWTRAGQIVARLTQRRLVSRGGFTRSFINDCLLAASCRSAGVTIVVTRNPADFELNRRVEPVAVASPFPS